MGWNGSGQKGVAPVQPKVTAKKPSHVRGLIAGAVVLALACVAYIAFFADSEKHQKDVGEKRPTRIKEVTPAVAPTPVVEERRLTNKEIRKLPADQTNRLNAAEIEYWKMSHPWPPPDKNQPELVHVKSRIFANKVDNEIALLLTVEPGTQFIGDGSAFARDFERRFRRSIERPIEVVGNKEVDKDDEYAKSLKAAVIETKADLKARLDAGEDIEKIMRDTRNDLQKLGNYKYQLEQTVRKEAARARHKGASEEEVSDIVSAANKMLEERGVAPIEPNSIIRRAVQLQNSEGYNQ